MDKSELDRRIAENPFAALSDVIYHALYEDIIFLRITPGMKLNESRIADELGVSRTPVKNALARLAHDRLLLKKGGSISVVSPMAKQESRQLYEARIAIEGYAAFLAASRVTADQLEELGQLAEEYAEIGKHLDPATYAECDHRFHAIVIAAGGNDYIARIYESIESRLLHYRHCLLHEIGPQRLQPILSSASRHHLAVYNALRLGFADIARAEMERDIGGMNDVFSEWK
jgi:Transcriptional regulators